jgi:hypothetical protein
MATRRRPSPVRRRAVAPAGSNISYRQSRATIVLLIFILFFAFLWLFNGDLTARFVMRLTGADISVGWSTHLLISVIEIAPAILAPYLARIPRRLVVVLWLLSLPFGIFDVLSSAVGVAPYFVWTGAAGVVAHVQNVALAEAIGFLPEPMLYILVIALVSVLRGSK